VGTGYAAEIGLIDAAFGTTLAGFRERVRELVERLACDPVLDRRREYKRRQRADDERIKPLSAYRTEELDRSHGSFFGEDSSYHEGRRRFVYKLPSSAASNAPLRQEGTGASAMYG
jgi:putative two-component system hydrogenase maturation factor HypX/HoxX